jgi:hypothetical protein
MAGHKQCQHVENIIVYIVKVNIVIYTSSSTVNDIFEVLKLYYVKSPKGVLFELQLWKES